MKGAVCTYIRSKTQQLASCNSRTTMERKAQSVMYFSDAIEPSMLITSSLDFTTTLAYVQIAD